MLHIIPLTVVESRKEVDDVKELITICKEYHIALRCELRRKVCVCVCVWFGGHGCTPHVPVHTRARAHTHTLVVDVCEALA